MNRREFLKKLKEALENDLSGSVVQENINYYDQYISDEVNNGRSEAEVVAMLGDPWMIARTVIDAAEMGIHQEETYSRTSEQQYTQQDYTKEDTQQSGQDILRNMFQPVPKWKKFAFAAGLIAVVVLVFSIISGLISLLAPIVIPIILIVFVFKLWNNRK